MIHRRFGRTELEMPVFSCGGMRYQHSWNASKIGEASAENQRNLEATIERALEVGICHVETARGYGTSEEQLGRVLSRLPRERLIVQTKVPPEPDRETFRANVEDSLRRLQLESVDLFAFHGLNNDETIEQTLRTGGCYEEALRLRDEGKLKHIGFSTHAPTARIIELAESDRFDYVNLHWYYIFQDNWPAIRAANAQDMGVFIISPSDKGGMLYRPSEKLRRLCEPYSPMVFNDLFCLSRPDVHTLSIGASRPDDFDEHLKVLELLESECTELETITQRLDEAYAQAVGREFAASWRDGLPDWTDVPGEVNLKTIVWLRNLVKAYDLVEYGKMRYKLLATGGGHWFPGRPVDKLPFSRLDRVVASSPHRDILPGVLREAHELLHTPLTFREKYGPLARRAVDKLRRIKHRLVGRRKPQHAAR